MGFSVFQRREHSALALTLVARIAPAASSCPLPPIRMVVPDRAAAIPKELRETTGPATSAVWRQRRPVWLNA